MREPSADEDVEVLTLRWPGDDADDETKAGVLARNMARNGSLTEDQALAFAYREVFGFPPGRTAETLGVSREDVADLVEEAKERIRAARGLLEAVEAAGDAGEGFDRKTIRTSVPVEEYRLMHDDFASDVYHDRGESLAGTLLADTTDDEPAGVFVLEQAGERTDGGAPGYIVEHLLSTGECDGRYAAAAEYVQKRIDAGELVPARLELRPVEE